MTCLFRRRNRSRNSGFTLIEVMLAVVVFAFMTIVFSGTFITSLRAGRMNSQYAQATSMCQHKIDQLRAVGYGRLTYAELSDAGIIDAAPTAPPYSFTGVDQVRNYLTQATTSIQVSAVSTNVVRVTVSVSWRNVVYQNKLSSTSLTAYITNVE